jgi:hypothetical protein
MAPADFDIAIEHPAEMARHDIGPDCLNQREEAVDMAHGYFAIVLARNLEDFIGLLERQGQRFFDQNMSPDCQGIQADRCVGATGCGNHNQIRPHL